MDLLFLLKALTAFFVIIDPVGMSLLFKSLASEFTDVERKRIAVKACFISCMLLIFFGVYGEVFLAFLGISINALKISGGLLLFYTAFKMVTSSLSFRSENPRNDISVFPLSIPLLAGPGSLTVSILIFSEAPNMIQMGAASMAIVVIMCLTLLLMIFSHHVSKVIRRTGDEIIRRFLGVLLAALAVQFILDGIANALNLA